MWYPKIFTFFSQIINATYLSLLITFFFHKRFKSEIVFFLIIIFVSIPHSLTNFFHFSEAGYYFQILIPVLSFFLLSKKNKVEINILILTALFVANFLNMEMAALIFQYSLLAFYFLKYFINRNKSDLILFVYCVLLLVLHYVLIYNTSFGVALYDGSNTIDKDFTRSLYLFFVKSFFYPLSFTLFFGFTFLMFIFKFFSKNKNLNEFEFILLPLIFFIVSVAAISFNRIQIYDRYKDLYAIGGFLSLFFLNYFYFDYNKYLKSLIVVIISLMLINNEYRFFNKMEKQRKISNLYDYEIKKQINLFKKDKNHKINKNDISENKIINNILVRYEDLIKLSLKNNIID
tara:strand:- start:159 stop:1196 length:1038 start_codon:yes stop_codon:yes gene_type:complete